jgi:hypothetical protein
MIDQIVALFQFFFNSYSSIGTTFADYAGSATAATLTNFINSVAIAIKPIGYSLLCVFALLEFAQLSERVGNVTGFMGAGLVINVLVELILCKLVVDNSTEICNFLITLGDNLTEIVLSDTSQGVFSPDNLYKGIRNAFPNWWDILGQIGFFLVSCLFIFIASLGILIVKIVYLARFIQLFVYTAVSPIPLSTCLSKHFNVATNFIKSFFAVCLQGALLILVQAIFGSIFTTQINGVSNITQGDWGALWSMLGSILFYSILFVVTAFQTQKWANSICHAM